VSVSDDGSIVAPRADGSTAVVSDGGMTMTVTAADGSTSTTTVGDDGSTTTVAADGTTTTVAATVSDDGSTVAASPDGSSVAVSSDGTKVTTTAADGTVMATTTSAADGSTTTAMTDADGNTSELTVGDDGSVLSGGGGGNGGGDGGGDGGDGGGGDVAFGEIDYSDIDSSAIEFSAGDGGNGSGSGASVVATAAVSDAAGDHQHTGGIWIPSGHYGLDHYPDTSHTWYKITTSVGDGMTFESFSVAVQQLYRDAISRSLVPSRDGDDTVLDISFILSASVDGNGIQIAALIEVRDEYIAEVEAAFSNAASYSEALRAVLPVEITGQVMVERQPMEVSPSGKSVLWGESGTVGTLQMKELKYLVDQGRAQDETGNHQSSISNNLVFGGAAAGSVLVLFYAAFVMRKQTGQRSSMQEPGMPSMSITPHAMRAADYL
jgi:hypothetical protein